MKKVVRVSLKVLKYILLLLFIIIAFTSIYNIFCSKVLKQDFPMILGMSYSVVISQSMEPTLYIGDVIIVQKCDSYNEGDIIVFNGTVGTTTHRVSEVTVNGYITWGDNRTSNPVPDEEIPASSVYGKVIKIYSKIGYVFLFFKSPPGLVCLFMMLLGFVFIPSAVDKFFDKRDAKKENEKKEIIATIDKESLKKEILKEMEEQNIIDKDSNKDQ